MRYWFPELILMFFRTSTNSSVGFAAEKSSFPWEPENRTTKRFQSLLWSIRMRLWRETSLWPKNPVFQTSLLWITRLLWTRDQLPLSSKWTLALLWTRKLQTSETEQNKLKNFDENSSLTQTNHPNLLQCAILSFTQFFKYNLNNKIDHWKY